MVPEDGKCPECGKPLAVMNGVKGATTVAACSKCGAIGCKRCIVRGRCPRHRRPPQVLTGLANSSADASGQGRE